MIKIRDIQLQFSNMGYFNGKEDWIHPKRVLNSYELIFVVKGEVFLREESEYFHLRAGDAICLQARREHAGYQRSDNAAFYWLHFFAENYQEIGVYRFHVADMYNYELKLRQWNHLYATKADGELIECELGALLLKQKYEQDKKNKLIYDICEYIRLQAYEKISVTEIAKRFNYNADYLTKLFIKNTGQTLKKYIDSERNSYVKNLLVSTQMSLKEIAALTSFDDDVALIKFFTYHNQISPTVFRNTYYASHLNNR